MFRVPPPALRAPHARHCLCSTTASRALPPRLREALSGLVTSPDEFNAIDTVEETNVTDIIVDIGRPVTLYTPGSMHVLLTSRVTREDIDRVLDAVASSSSSSLKLNYGRMRIGDTPHRLSLLADHDGSTSGLTLRIMRQLDHRDVLNDEIRSAVASRKSIIVFGPPGAGKTTMLRAMADFSADSGRRTVIVDTSGEFWGTAARRACVPCGETLGTAAATVVRNHTPSVLIMDELVSPEDAYTAAVSTSRGVQVLASAHASSVDDLFTNPVLRDRLFGGVQHAAVSDARARGSSKFVASRRGPVAFELAIDCTKGWPEVVEDLQTKVDSMLRENADLKK